MKSRLEYFKGNGTKNDFVIIEDLNDKVEISPQQIQAICDRKTGIGADGILKVVKKENKFFMDYRNSDGTVAEMCGNGARVFALYLITKKLVNDEKFTILTRTGDIDINFINKNEISVTMKKAVLRENRVDVLNNNQVYKAIGVDAPNPHAVVFVDDLSEIGDLKIAPSISPSEEFKDGVNVEFVKKINDGHAAMRVFERGSGETLSCGTGACAVAAVLNELSLTKIHEFQIDVQGGTLFIEFDKDKMIMTGPAVLENSGILNDSWYSIKS